MGQQSRDLAKQDGNILAFLLVGGVLTIAWFASYRTGHQERVRTKQQAAELVKTSFDTDILATILQEHAQTHGVRCSLAELIQHGVIDEGPADVWGNEYTVFWQAGTSTAAVSSHGPDGIANTADDIANKP